MFPRLPVSSDLIFTSVEQIFFVLPNKNLCIPTTFETLRQVLFKTHRHKITLCTAFRIKLTVSDESRESLFLFKWNARKYASLHASSLLIHWPARSQYTLLRNYVKLRFQLKRQFPSLHPGQETCSKNQHEVWATNLVPKAYFATYLRKRCVAFAPVKPISVSSRKLSDEDYYILTEYCFETGTLNTNTYFQRRTKP